MGNSSRWQLCLLLLILAMIVGFARVEHLKTVSTAPEKGAQDDEAGDPDDDQVHGDPISDFLTRLIGDGPQEGADAGLGAPLPLVKELPALPEPFWPLSNPFNKAMSADAESATP